jgi:transcriptional regulator with XRE-family HTH domain/urease accessory protein UreF
MPRPSKPVSPNTLGGRIRAARKSLRLSLAEVADGHYSTSLLSQIERNRIDPSSESLKFLADRLKLPLEDLDLLAHQHHENDHEQENFSLYEDLLADTASLFKNNEISEALSLLLDLQFPQIPSAQRWQLAALRGQCYFTQRQFLKAQQDFIYAVREQPAIDELSAEQYHDLILLHLHLAGTYRELQMLEDALDQYHVTLRMMNSNTPSGYMAEAHWGLALVTFAQANKPGRSTHDTQQYREDKLRLSLEHAEHARFLYRTIKEHLLAATVTSQIARIELALGHKDQARNYLTEILTNWSDVLHQPLATSGVDKRIQQKEANLVSAAACTMAGIELEENHYEQAHIWVERALQAGQRSYRLRRADAYLMQARILESINPKDPLIEDALRKATAELADTDRIARRIDAHAHLGRHLLKLGREKEGERELEQTRLLLERFSNFVIPEPDRE